DHFSFDRTVTMNSMHAHCWNGDRGSGAVIISIERRTEMPRVNDDQIIWGRCFFELASDEIDVGQAFVRAFPERERQKGQGSSGKSQSRHSNPMSSCQYSAN